jgi:hypothetical protein
MADASISGFHPGCVRRVRSERHTDRNIESAPIHNGQTGECYPSSRVGRSGAVARDRRASNGIAMAKVGDTAERD